MPPKRANNLPYRSARYCQFIHEDSPQQQVNMRAPVRPSNYEPRSRPQLQPRSSQQTASTANSRSNVQSAQSARSGSSLFQQMENPRMQRQFREEQKQFVHNMLAQPRWNSESQLGTKSKMVLQAKKYFKDTDNVFHSDTRLMKEKGCWDCLFWPLIILVLFFSGLWGAIYSISPYDKECPKHATCEAYVDCHQGYILSRIKMASNNSTIQICQIDPQITQTAFALMTSVVQDLKYEYGLKQCTVQSNMTKFELEKHLSPPRKSYFQIFSQLNINSDQFKLLKVQIMKHFQQKSNQVIGKFSVSLDHVVSPLEKYYTTTCKINMVYRDYFMWFVLAGIIAAGLLVLFISRLPQILFRRKAKKIYNFLKQQVKTHKVIHYSQYRKEIEQKLNSGKQIGEQLFKLVHDFRIAEQQIGYYDEIDKGIILKWLSN